jgi:serine/threonine protein kinase
MSADEIVNTVKTATANANVNAETGGLQINGYGDLQKIGEGGMARVYRAVHLGLERDVALKVLKPGSGDDDFSARFLRKARIMAKLAHPNIIQIYDVNQLDGSTSLPLDNPQPLPGSYRHGQDQPWFAENVTNISLELVYRIPYLAI